MDQLISRAAQGLAVLIWGWVAAVCLQWAGITFSGENAAFYTTALATFITTILIAVFDWLERQPWIQKRLPLIRWIIRRLWIVPTRPRYLSDDERRLIIGRLEEEMPTRFASVGDSAPVAKLIDKLQ